MQAEQERLKNEQTLENLKAQEAKYETKIESTTEKIKQLEAQMKTLLQQGNRTKAKQLLKKVKMERESLVNLQNKQGFISKQVMQIGAVSDDDAF